jgi:hypothetical protein
MERRQPACNAAFFGGVNRRGFEAMSFFQTPASCRRSIAGDWNAGSLPATPRLSAASTDEDSRR